MRLLFFCIALTIALPCGATTAFLSSFQEGVYEAHIISVIPEENDTRAAMELTRRGDAMHARIHFENGHREEWEWDTTKLIQKRYDATNQLIETIRAQADTRAEPHLQTYHISCAEMSSRVAQRRCASQTDARYSWTLEAWGASIQYASSGVSQEHRKDPRAKPRRRRLLLFSRIGDLVQPSEHVGM